MEDLGLAATGQGHLQGLQAELLVKAVRKLQTVHVPGEQIHNHRQVQEALPQLDVGDICRPDRLAATCNNLSLTEPVVVESTSFDCGL